MPAEDVAFEVRHQPALVQLQFDLEAVSTGCAGDAASVLVMNGYNGLHCATNGLQVTNQPRIAPLTKALHPVFGQRLAGVRFNHGALIFDGFANEKPHAFSRRQHPARLGQHVTKHTICDGFTVDQNAVTVEEYGIKCHGLHYLIAIYSGAARARFHWSGGLKHT